MRKRGVVENKHYKKEEHSDRNWEWSMRSMTKYIVLTRERERKRNGGGWEMD